MVFLPLNLIEVIGIVSPFKPFLAVPSSTNNERMHRLGWITERERERERDQPAWSQRKARVNVN